MQKPVQAGNLYPKYLLRSVLISKYFLPSLNYLEGIAFARIGSVKNNLNSRID